MSQFSPHNLEENVSNNAKRYMQNDMKILGELVKQVAKTMAKLTEDQLALSTCLQHLSEELADAQADFECHHRIQDVMSKNALCLIEAFRFFQEEIGRFVKNELQPAWMQVNMYVSFAYFVNQRSIT